MDNVLFSTADLADCAGIEPVCCGQEREVTGIYCCDLLSMVMGRAQEGDLWITVMGNVNAIAVAALADVACIVVAEGAVLDDAARKKAVDQEITVLKTEEPIFEAALAVWNKLQAGAHEEP